MPPPRRVASVLADRSIPRRTRLSLLGLELRRRLAGDGLLRVRYPSADLFVTRDDYEVDWETLKSIVSDGIYPADYDGAVVLDIGAHKGYYGAYVLAHGARRVVSFEPESANADLVRRSIAGRPSDVWSVEEAAVGSVAGEAELHVMDASWGHALAPPESWAEYEVETRRVPVVAFDDALARATAGLPDARVVVKMNIEGAECDVVLGTPAETWRRVDEVVVATHPWTACTDADVERHLGAAGLSPLPGGHPRVLRLRREAPPPPGPRSGST